MLIDNDYYLGLIPDDGLVNDFELGRRLQDSSLLDELLNHELNQILGFKRSELCLK